MSDVTLVGWRPGLNAIALIKLLQEAGLSLKSAKDSVDSCLAGERVTIPVDSAEAAEQLAHRATDLGAVVQVRTRR